MSDKIIEAVFKRFEAADSKLDLLSRIAEKLIATEDGHDTASPDKVVLALRRLVADGKFLLPKDAVSKADFKDSFINDARNALETVLKASGQPQLVAAGKLSVGAIKFINNIFDRCGGNDLVERPHGPPVEQKNGRHLFVYWVEEDAQERPLLPPVEGSVELARSKLKSGFENWEGVLKLDVTRTGDRTAANLIVTGRDFGPEIDDSVLALTDIGPPGNVQLRMVFDTAEKTLTREQFVALAAHEFGHALGIKHSDVPSSGQLMNGLLSTISEPEEGDKRAAEAKGWTRSV
jgi:Matrixin